MREVIGVGEDRPAWRNMAAAIPIAINRKRRRCRVDARDAGGGSPKPPRSCFPEFVLIRLAFSRAATTKELERTRCSSEIAGGQKLEQQSMDNSIIESGRIPTFVFGR